MPRLNSIDSLFTAKLQEILESSETRMIISWGQNNHTIQINDKRKLIQDILPKYFRHQRFESFVRQMNLYGFKKIRCPGKHCFANLELKNGRKQIIIQFQRLTELKSKNQLKRLQVKNKKNPEISLGDSEESNSDAQLLNIASEKNSPEKRELQNCNGIENIQGLDIQKLVQNQSAMHFPTQLFTNQMPINPFPYWQNIPYNFFWYQGF